MNKDRYKNIYFWLGLFGVLLSATGLNLNSLTSWALVIDALKGVILNPVTLVSVILAGVGVFTNPNTKGFKD